MDQLSWWGDNLSWQVCWWSRWIRGLIASVNRVDLKATSMDGPSKLRSNLSSACSECASFLLGFFFYNETTAEGTSNKTVSCKFREIYFRVSTCFNMDTCRHDPWHVPDLIHRWLLALFQVDEVLAPFEAFWTQHSQFYRCTVLYVYKITSDFMINWEKCDCETFYGQNIVCTCIYDTRSRFWSSHHHSRLLTMDIRTPYWGGP